VPLACFLPQALPSCSLTNFPLPPWFLQVAWHKGTALNHLLQELGLQSQEDVVSIYIGDDRTDEDAFKVLQEGRQGEEKGREG
jgi:hypothetical protein